MGERGSYPPRSACLPSFPFLFFSSVFAPHPFLPALVVFYPNEMGRAIEVGRDFPSSLLIVLFLFQSSFLLLNGENPSTQQQPNKQMMVWALHLPCLLDSCCLFMWAVHFFLVPAQSSKWTQMEETYAVDVVKGRGRCLHISEHILKIFASLHYNIVVSAIVCNLSKFCNPSILSSQCSRGFSGNLSIIWAGM